MEKRLVRTCTRNSARVVVITYPKLSGTYVYPFQTGVSSPNPVCSAPIMILSHRWTSLITTLWLLFALDTWLWRYGLRNRCKHFGTFWACVPAAGDISAKNDATAHPDIVTYSHNHGVVTHLGRLEKSYDSFCFTKSSSKSLFVLLIKEKQPVSDFS